MENNKMEIIQMTKPVQCHLWTNDNVCRDDLDYDNLELIETFVDESHFSRWLVQCKECGQLYFKEFYEEIDWIDGDDPQYVTYVPVKNEDEIEKLKKTNIFEIMLFQPCLRKDYPKGAEKPKVYWLGKN